jgi:hypothetical protein
MQDDDDEVPQSEGTGTELGEESSKTTPDPKLPQLAGEGGGGVAPALEDPDDPELWLEDDSSDPCPGQPEQDPTPGDVLDLRIQRETAEALKPIVTEKIYYRDPQTDDARGATEKAYRAAFHRPDGLSKKYERADWTFGEIGEDLKEKVNGKTLLQRWIREYLSPGKELFEIFQDRKRIEAALVAAMGPRECRFRTAEERLKGWNKAYQDWKAPAAKIEAIIDSYAPLLETLRTQVHEGSNYAIYRYWFEVAPRHLHLRDEAVLNSNAYGITAISKALRKFPDRRRALQSGKVLGDGSLFLLNPGVEPERPLQDQQELVLKGREDSAKSYARLKAMFESQPDTVKPLAKQLEEVTRSEADAKRLFPA